MNTFLISLGAALVLVLTAALIGPRFVDWDGYRGVVEAEGEELLGRPVTIGEDLEVRILPTPLVRARSVALADPDGGPALVEAREIELKLDLGSLIAGAIEVTDLVLIEPRLQLDRLAVDFARTIRARPPATSSRPARLRRIEARDATVVFADPMSGEERSIARVNAQVTATALTGPFKVQGQYGEPGVGVDDADRPSFSASIGSIARAAPVQLAGRIDLVELGGVTFDGELSDLARSPRYTGNVRIEQPIAARGGAAGRLAFEAAADIAAGEAEFSDLRVTATEGASVLSLAGSGRASWTDRPRFSADLRTRQIDLDAALGRTGDTAIAGGLAAAAAAFGELVTDRGAEGRLQVTIDGMIWREELARDIVTSLSIAPDAVNILSLHASLPGETDVKLSGRIDLADARFAGSIVAETIETARLVRWIAPSDGAALADVLADARGKFSIKGDVEATRHMVALDEVEGFVDAHAFTGALGFERGGGIRPRFNARIDLDRFDLDRFLPDGITPMDLFALTAAPGGMAVDVSLSARAKRMTLFGREAEGVEIAGALADDAFDIEMFAIGNYIDSSINLRGRIKPTADGPIGAVLTEVSSRSLPRLIDALGLSGAGVLGWDIGAPLNVDVADLILSVESEPDGVDHASTVALTGDLAGIAVKVTALSDAPLPRFPDGTIEVSASAEAGDARHLFGPNGLYPLLGADLPAGTARVSVNAAGRIADGLDGSGVVDALGAVIEAGGRTLPGGGARGSVSVRISEPARFARALGLAPGGGEKEAPVLLEASFEAGGEAGGGTVALNNITADFAGTLMTAEATVTRGAPPAIDLRFDAQRASLGWIAASAFAPDAGPGQGAGAGEPGLGPRIAVWPTDLVDVTALGAARLSATGHIARLALGAGMVLGDAQVELALNDGVLDISRLEGSLAGGEVAITGSIAGADHALIVDGEVAARQVRLADFLADARGRELVTGQADIKADFTARGRSLLSLVSSLEGTGRMTVVDASLARLDLPSVLGVTDIADASTVVDAVLMAGRPGETRIFAGPGTLEASNGRIRIGPLDIAAAGLAGEATSFIDVASRRLDQELVLEERGTDPVHLALIHAGPFGEIGREIEITNLPALGSARWTEPFDDFALPGPSEPEPPLAAPVPFGPTPAEEAGVTGPNAGVGEAGIDEDTSAPADAAAPMGESEAAPDGQGAVDDADATANRPAEGNDAAGGEPDGEVEIGASPPGASSNGDGDGGDGPDTSGPAVASVPADEPSSDRSSADGAATAADVTEGPRADTAAERAPPAPAGPPVGLIGQEVIDLPLLEEVGPRNAGGGPG